MSHRQNTVTLPVALSWGTWGRDTEVKGKTRTIGAALLTLGGSSTTKRGGQLMQYGPGDLD